MNKKWKPLEFEVNELHLVAKQEKFGPQIIYYRIKLGLNK